MKNEELKKAIEDLKINGILEVNEQSKDDEFYFECKTKALNPNKDGKESFFACIGNGEDDEGVATFELLQLFGEEDAGSIVFTMAADARYDCDNKLAHIQWNSETKSTSFQVEFPANLLNKEWLKLAVRSMLELNYRYDLIAFQQKTLRDAVDNELITQEQAIEKVKEKKERIALLLSSEPKDNGKK